MKKRTLLNLLVICMILAALALTAAATEVTEPVRAANECGAGITWEYADGVLTISGDGEMDDFGSGAPWAAHRADITEVVVAGDVTYIGAYAFKNYDALKTVDFGDALYEIGREAFASCDGLTSIDLPSTFKIFGEGSFQSCENLEQIHCSGVFPSFRQNCLWSTYVTIYYPAERPWGVEYIQQLEEAFHGRVEFLAEDGTDHYEPTEAPAEPEETVPETAEPETVPPTEAAVPVTEPPATAAPTEPPVTTPAPTETEAPTEEETVPVQTKPVNDEEEDGGIPTGLIIVGVVLVLLVLGAVVFGAGGKKGRYSKRTKGRR